MLFSTEKPVEPEPELEEQLMRGDIGEQLAPFGAGQHRICSAGGRSHRRRGGQGTGINEGRVVGGER